jgi:hypothetical protein
MDVVKPSFTRRLCHFVLARPDAQDFELRFLVRESLASDEAKPRAIIWSDARTVAFEQVWRAASCRRPVLHIRPEYVL